MQNPALQEIFQQLANARKARRKQVLFKLISRWVFVSCLIFLTVFALGSFVALSPLWWKALVVFWSASLFLITFLSVFQWLNDSQEQRELVANIEQRLPDLEQRLLTSLEFAGDEEKARRVSKELLSLLEKDAEQKVSESPIDVAATVDSKQQSQWHGLAATVGVVAVAVSLIFASDIWQSLRYFAWPSPWVVSVEDVVETDYQVPVTIDVTPGDITIQRGDNLQVSAQLSEGEAKQLKLFVQDDQLNWREITMLPKGDPTKASTSFVADIFSVTRNTQYYVVFDSAEKNTIKANSSTVPSSEPSTPESSTEEASPKVTSPQYTISLFDMPRVDDITLDYRFPEYTAMENKTEKNGGDILAPEGTQITLFAEINKPVSAAEIVFDIGDAQSLEIDTTSEFAMASEKTVVTGKFPITQNDNYFIRVTDNADNINSDPDNYYIRVIEDQRPDIVLKTPGRDAKVMPLEEVQFEIDASDDYGLTQFEFVYQVVGMDEKRINFLNKKSAKENNPLGNLKKSGSTLLYLEDLEVKPGDVISYSVQVADNNAIKGKQQVSSDIYFLEVTPVDHRFSRQSGGAGGQGGGQQGGGDGNALVANQKDVIAATWKLKNRRNQVDDDSFSADGEIIRESQAEVVERTKMSISRLTERGQYQDENYQNAVLALQRAIKEMEGALEELDMLALDTALQAEQRALQEMLKAESQINRTEVAMNRNQGGGGGGSQQRDRQDLRELFEMELGELENRYEMPQQQAGGQQQQADQKLDKLKELAKRQERLTRQQRELARRQEELSEEQKQRQLEQLRREQENLRRELADLSQSMQQSQQQSQQQNSQQQGQQNGQASSSNSSSGQSQGQNQSQQLAQRLQQAMNEMQQAESSDSASQAAAKSQKALDALKEQLSQMSQGSDQSVASMQEQIKQQAEELVNAQRQLREDLQSLSRKQSLADSKREAAQSADAEQLMKQQQEIKDAMAELNKNLRDLAANAEADDPRAMQQSHNLTRDLRPIQDKMDTSRMILQRGMVNLSLKLESDIESALSGFQRSLQNLSGGEQNDDDQQAQLANQVRDLRRTLEQMQQIAQQSGNADDADSSGLTDQNTQQRNAQVPDTTGTRTGERSGALQRQQASREMQQSLSQAREQARELEQLGRAAAQAGGAAGGGAWYGDARSIRNQLTDQGLAEFMNRPELLRNLLQPLIELENRLRTQTELQSIENRLYSVNSENVPEEYKRMVENYYRELSESKPGVR